jgi:asparagine synthase (glutamine-hydrolysing)
VCGIAGTLGLPRDIAARALEQMCGALRHRGPDGSGVELVEGPDPLTPVGLAHTRLAIIDLSAAGRQPMASAGGGARIVYNGEIYNHRELRRELTSRGAQFQTRTDTEVILRAYEAWGTKAVQRLRGMFAFCILDVDRGSVWLCRDRLGQKPLYLARTSPRGLLFASEMRALLAVGTDLVPRRVNPAAIVSFLAQGMVCGNDAIAENITLLAPATSLVLDLEGKELARRCYWAVPSPQGTADVTYQESLRDVRDALRDAVDGHLIADVPLGLFLSSGIDSTALATIAAEVQSATIHTITIGFDDPTLDESADAEAIARELGTDHRTVRMGGAEILEDIDEVFEAMDQPTVDGFNTYFVSRAARRSGLTVALSGVGGDELFGGYASFRDVPRALRASRIVRRIAFAVPMLERAVRMTGGRRGVKVAEALLRSPDALGAYLLRRELFLAAERRELGASSASCDSTTGLPLPVLDELQTLVDDRDLANTMSRLELAHYMGNMLLRDADAFSMASSLELRAPFLDDRVVEVVSRLPGKWKGARPHTKKLLTDAVGSRLPRRVIAQPKRGFTFPWATWLRGPLKERARVAIADADVWSAVGLNPDVPHRLWLRFLRRDPRVVALQIIALWVLAETVRRMGLRPSL